MGDGDVGHTRIDNRLLLLFAAVFFGVGSAGVGVYNAVTPADLARDDHDRLVRIETLVVTYDARMAAIEAVAAKHDAKIDEHAGRIVAIETELEYLRGDQKE